MALALSHAARCARSRCSRARSRAATRGDPGLVPSAVGAARARARGRAARRARDGSRARARTRRHAAPRVDPPRRCGRERAERGARAAATPRPCASIRPHVRSRAATRRRASRWAPTARVHVSWSSPRRDAGGSPFASDLVLATLRGRRAQLRAAAAPERGPARLARVRVARGRRARRRDRGVDRVGRGAGRRDARRARGGRSRRPRSPQLGDAHVPVLSHRGGGRRRGPRRRAVARRVPGQGARHGVRARRRATPLAFARGRTRARRRLGVRRVSAPRRRARVRARRPRARGVVQRGARAASPRSGSRPARDDGFAAPLALHEGAGSLPDRVALAIGADGAGLVLWERRSPVRSEIAARSVSAQGRLGAVRVAVERRSRVGPRARRGAAGWVRGGVERRGVPGAAHGGGGARAESRLRDRVISMRGCGCPRAARARVAPAAAAVDLVAQRILLVVVLVIVLGRIERPGGADRRDDRLLERVARVELLASSRRLGAAARRPR